MNISVSESFFFFAKNIEILLQLTLGHFEYFLKLISYFFFQLGSVKSSKINSLKVHWVPV